MEVALADASRDGRLNRVEQVAFHPHHDRLRLRITEAAVEFQHHRPARGHHDAAIQDALVLRAFRFHARHHGLGNVRHQPVSHLRVDNLVGGVRPHAPGVRPLVVIENAFVVLRGDQWDYPLAVRHHEERELFAFQEFLQHHPGSGFAEHLAAQHFFCSVQGLIFRLRDYHALASGQSVGFYDDGRVEVCEGRL